MTFYECYAALKKHLFNIGEYVNCWDVYERAIECKNNAQGCDDCACAINPEEN